jgi:DNA processing protein
MTPACEDCLRHSHLIAFLAPRIAGMLDHPGRRTRGVLALGDQELIARVAGNRRDAALRFIEEFDEAAARERIAAAEVEAVCRHSPGYPAGLTQLADPPRVLYCAGATERFESLVAEPGATIVGSRKASAYGLQVAQQLGRGLSAAGVTVVSGLALGIDAAAHRGALEVDGPVIAVLACGPDLAYPPQHLGLYKQVRRQGVVISEMPPGTRALRWSFPARNRIMAALGRITVVVEAADPSGSLITATFAGDLGRGVAAVPGKVTSRLAAGSNRLLSDGARVVRGTEDVLDELFGVGSRPRVKRRPEPKLGPGLRAVLDGVERGEGIGEIAARSGMRASEVRAALGRLEREGLIVLAGFGAYERTADE